MDAFKGAVTSSKESCERLRLTLLALDITLADLPQQLVALNTILTILNNNIDESSIEEFTKLALIVKMSKEICEDLTTSITQIASTSSASSYTDWTNFKCRGTDIADLGDQLKLHNATIFIKMLDMGLSAGLFKLGPNAANEYNEIIQDARLAAEDLMAKATRRLEEIEATKAAEEGFDNEDLVSLSREGTN